MQQNKKIPAEYIGAYPVQFPAPLGPYFNANGERLTDLVISKGDTIMMPEVEILGQTFFRTRSENEPDLHLGAGKVVKVEHAHLSHEELLALGYEFHAGRPDFRPVPVVEQQQPATPPPPVQVDVQSQVTEINTSW